VLLPGEPTAFRLGGVAARDARAGVIALDPDAGQPFAQAWRVRTERVPEYPYQVQLSARTSAPVQRDDTLLASFYVRTVETAAETGAARTSFVFELAAEPYTKSAQLAVDATRDWQRIDLPFRAADSYAAGRAQVNFQLGHGPQTIEIGGVSLLGYGRGVGPEALPRTRLTYTGREPDAGWRLEARHRLAATRKADLLLRVLDPQGQPVPGVAVAVCQRRHAFGFGSAVAAAQLVTGGPDGERYREHVRRSFSKVVLENDLKWPNWEDAAQRPRTLQALAWLRAQGIAVRGHTLVWPGWSRLPRDVQSLRHDPAALRRRVAEHITDEVSALRGQVVEWDVVNEPHQNHDLMDVLGDDVLAEWFWLAHEADPSARLFLNEATVPGFGPRQDRLERTVRRLLDAGAPIGGIGLQCHFGANVDAPLLVLRGLDRFAQLGLPIQITELDVDTTDEALQADYLRDFLIATFGHPAVDAVLMWGFWAGRHWRPDAALYRRDWAIKPSGQAWLDLVADEWRTETLGLTDGAGALGTRGFLGDYQIAVEGSGASAAGEVTLAAPGATVEVVLDATATPGRG
jgi:GH35 family endo-1,4-beta-xylanase